MFVQLNAAHNQLQQANAQISHLQTENGPLYSTKKDFWQLGRSGRLTKRKEDWDNLSSNQLRDLKEFVPLEVSFSFILWDN